MSDETNARADATEPEMTEPRKGLLSRVSIVWLLPILAVVISLSVAWRSYSDQGPLIEVTFNDAAGVRAEETQLRYRDVVVGLVETVRFSENLGQVVVEIRVNNEVAPFIDEDAAFWIVRPEVSAQGVSGLDTVLGGVYMMGSWDGEIGAPETEFEGLTRAPLVTNNRDGLYFQLRASDVAGLSENAPILYRGINVGQVGNLRLADDGVSVLADAFVREPESRLINSATRFWDTSGFTFSFGASGAQLSVNSLSSLVSGGVSFETTVSGGQPLDENPTFRLFPSEEAARSSVFEASGNGEPVSFTVVFEDSVPGLEVGADVEFGGIVVGRVSGLTGVLDEESFGDRGVRLLTTIEIQPGKMGLDPQATPEDVLDFMEFAVQNGLRAQLTSASLLGGLQVSLEQTNDAPDAEVVADAEPYPRIPSIPADLSDFADTAEGVFNRVNNLPIEELLDNAILVMQSVNRLLNDEGIQETPSEVLALLGDVRSFVNSEGIQAIPQEANATMVALSDTAVQLQDLVTRLNEAGAVTALADALTAAEEAANSVFETMEDGPETLEQVNAAVAELETLIAEVNTLPLNEVVTEVEGTLAALRTFLASDATQGLTGDVSELLTEVEGLVADVRESGLVETANATLETLSQTVVEIQTQATPILEEVRRAVASAQGSISALPTLLGNVDQLVATLNDVAQGVDQLPLDQTLGNVNDLLISVDTLVSSDGISQLPQDVQATLGDLRLVFTSLTEQNGTIDQVNGLIGDAGATVADVNAAIQPIVTQVEPVLLQLRETLEATQAPLDRLPEVLDTANALLTSLDLVASDVAELPLDQTVATANQLLTSIDTLVSSDGISQLPQDVQATLADLRLVFTSLTEENGTIDQVNGLVGDAGTTVADVNAAIQPIVTEVQPLIQDLRTTLQATQGPINQLPGVLDDVDALLASLNTVADNVATLPLDRAVANVNDLLVSVDTLVSSEAVSQLPAEVQTTLADLRIVFTSLTEQNGVLENANDLLVSTDSAVGEISAALSPVLADAQRAARAVADAADTAPEVADRAKRVADQIELLVNDVADLPIQEIGDRTSSLLASADTLISSPETQRVPTALSNALEEVQRLLIQVQEGGLIENANATLTSIRQSADQVPTLLTNVGGLLTQTGTIIEGYDARGTLGAEVQSTLRDIQSAASSVDSLARQIERNPNSLLFGR